MEAEIKRIGRQRVVDMQTYFATKAKLESEKKETAEENPST
jgi:hypothetical protein